MLMVRSIEGRTDCTSSILRTNFTAAEVLDSDMALPYIVIMNELVGKKTMAGKWVVAILMVISMILALLRWIYIPKTNPREADPGNPFHSPALQGDPKPQPPGK